MAKPAYSDLAAEVKQLRAETKAQAAELAVLKKTLATRGDVLDIAAKGQPVKRSSADTDWLTGLPSQDRKFFERRMGVKKE